MPRGQYIENHYCFKGEGAWNPRSTSPKREQGLLEGSRAPLAMTPSGLAWAVDCAQ